MRARCSHVASNPLYNTLGDERAATPAGASQTASNSFSPASACLQSVSGRPRSNPLFEAGDSTSRCEVRPRPSAAGDVDPPVLFVCMCWRPGGDMDL